MNEGRLWCISLSWVLATVILVGTAHCSGGGASGFSGKETVSSADGQVQVETDLVTRKVTVLRPTPIEMESIRKRADNGDAGAQMIISDVQYALKNYAEGERWLRKAVGTGNIYAEFLLGCELALRVHGGPARLEEGFAWLKLAAYEGCAGAQYELAGCYHRGIGVERNDLEAFTWFLITQRSGFRSGGVGKKSVLGYEKVLSNEQIEQAKVRANKFLPVTMDRNPFVDAGWLSLTTISESGGKPIAVINGETFAAGEQKRVMVIGHATEVRCLDVTTNRVIISSEPYWQRGELRRSG